MKLLLLLSFLANVALTAVSLAVLPERIAVHFGHGGAADGWAPARVHAAFMVTMQTVLFLLFAFAPRLVSRLPPRFVNLPHRDYWLSRANREATTARLARALHRFGTALFLFLLVVGLLVLKANRSAPAVLDERRLFVALGVFLLYTVAWCVELYLAFRLPAGARRRGGAETR